MGRRRTERLLPLADEHRDALVKMIFGAVELARAEPSMRRVARFQIKLLAWRWTADAFDPATNTVVPDAIKYSLRHQHHTTGVARIVQAGEIRGVRHEHVVPRGLLADEALQARSSTALDNLFARHCIAVLVTLAEDARLTQKKLRQRMPPGWTWGEEPFARYRKARISVREPTAASS